MLIDALWLRIGFLSSISATSTDGNNRIMFDDLTGYINGANVFNCETGEEYFNPLGYFVSKTYMSAYDLLIHSICSFIVVATKWINIGGTLAFGSYWFSGGLHIFHSLQFYTIVEGGIITEKGISCWFNSKNSILIEYLSQFFIDFLLLSPYGYSIVLIKFICWKNLQIYQVQMGQVMDWKVFILTSLDIHW